MADQIVYWTGASTLAVLALVLVFIGWRIASWAALCSKFILRIRAALARADHNVKWVVLFGYWWRLVYGSTPAPDYLVAADTDETVYFPGREGSRRYPA